MLKHCIRCVILLTIGLMVSGVRDMSNHVQAQCITPCDLIAVLGDGTLRRIRVPVLMYHYVSELPVNADAIRRDLTVTPAVFRTHIEAIARAGYTTISLYQLYDALMQGKPLPLNPVVLTFDDGYRDHYTSVYPTLREYGMTGTFFLITEQLDQRNPAYLTWEQAAEMAQGGMSMEPHTKTHAELDNRAYDFLVYEILGSQQSIQAHLGIFPRMFSYPVGRYDEYTLVVTESANVWLAVTTKPGALHTSTDPLEMPRVRIHGETSAAGVISQLQQDG